METLQQIRERLIEEFSSPLAKQRTLTAEESQALAGVDNEEIEFNKKVIRCLNGGAGLSIADYERGNIQACLAFIADRSLEFYKEQHDFDAAIKRSQASKEVKERALIELAIYRK